MKNFRAIIFALLITPISITSIPAFAEEVTGSYPNSANSQVGDNNKVNETNFTDQNGKNTAIIKGSGNIDQRNINDNRTIQYTDIKNRTLSPESSSTSSAGSSSGTTSVIDLSNRSTNKVKGDINIGGGYVDINVNGSISSTYNYCNVLSGNVAVTAMNKQFGGSLGIPGLFGVSLSSNSQKFTSQQLEIIRSGLSEKRLAFIQAINGNPNRAVVAQSIRSIFSLDAMSPSGKNTEEKAANKATILEAGNLLAQVFEASPPYNICNGAAQVPQTQFVPPFVPQSPPEVDSPKPVRGMN